MPDDPVTFADLIARVEDLEAGPSLQQLPLNALKDYMESDWQPNSGLLLQPASIGLPLLASDALAAFLQVLAAAAGKKANFGSATLTFPGGSPFTNTLNVAHGLAATPVLVLTTCNNGPVQLWASVPAGLTSTNIQLQARQSDGTSPALGAQTFGFWLAIG